MTSYSVTSASRRAHSHFMLSWMLKAVDLVAMRRSVKQTASSTQLSL